jgi:hypothetical protein
MYIDESGDPGSGTKHLVIAGAAIHEGQWAAVAEKVDLLQAKFFPHLTEPAELHSYDLRHGVGLFTGMSREERERVASEFYGMIASHPIGLSLFATATHKPSLHPSESAYERALEDIYSRFDLFLRRMYALGNPQKGLVVIDNTTLRNRLMPLMDRWRREGTRWGASRNVIETTFFLESGSSRIIQVADFTASAVFQNYEFGRSADFNRIALKFDREPETGKIHGLRHIISRSERCGCIACLQRLAR